MREPESTIDEWMVDSIENGGIDRFDDLHIDSGHRHRLPNGYCVTASPVLGGLHHEYWLKKEAA